MSVMSGGARVCDTAALLEATAEASKLDLNRQLHENVIAALDPDGVHVLTMVLWGHNVDTTSVLHHRLSCLLKVMDTMQPVCVFLDVTDAWWDRQPRYEDFMKALKGEGDDDADVTETSD